MNSNLVSSKGIRGGRRSRFLRKLLAPLLVAIVACSASCEDAARQDAPVRPAPPTHASAEQESAADGLLAGAEWYRHAVFYEVNVRSFADSNGDGIGDLDGLVSKLDYLKGLGVDALWMMPIHPTGFKDSGYDIADYRGISPEYGDMAAFERLITEAHARKMRVFTDLVLNHTSELHAWFQESRSSRTNPKSDWYIWSDTAGRADLGTCGADKPMFGNGWTLDPARNQYYFHRFYAEQPDLNYRNPEVVKETLDVLRFWLDKGVDGFRCDVIGKLFESPAGCSMLPETVEYIKQMRKVLDDASAMRPRAMVAEPSELTGTPSSYFGSGSDMFHMAFDFGYGYFWSFVFALRDRQLVEDAIMRGAAYPEGAQPAQVIGSHDVVRAWQVGGGERWKSENAALIAMTLKGTPFVYYGEELALRPGSQIVVDSRDTARTPMPWTREPIGHGFTTGTPWIAFGEAAAETSLEAEDGDPASMLTYYRQLLALRRGHAVWGAGGARHIPLDVRQLVAYVREDANEAYLVVVNLTDEAQTGAGDLPAAGELVFGDAELGGGAVKVPAMGRAIFKIR